MTKFVVLWRLAFIAYLILLSWQLLTPVPVVSVGGSDKLIHFAAFFVLACLAVLSAWKGNVVQYISALLSCAALTEIVQHFIPGRHFSVLDWVADALGIIFAVILSRYIVRLIPALNQHFSK